MRLTIVPPTAEGIALLVERFTGQKPSREWIEKTRALLVARSARSRS